MISEFPSIEHAAIPPHPEGLVCVVDHDESLRRSLERLLRSARFSVETYASAADFLESGPHPGPVCIVLDVWMPGPDVFELQETLANRSEQIVFLSGHGDVPMCARAMKAGAVDFLTKPVDDALLLSAVARGLERARDTGAAHAERALSRSRLDALTSRESEVMQCVVAGMLNKQIAAVLGIAEKTVKIHRGRMMRKTRSVSVPDLVRLVQRAGVSPRSAPSKVGS